MTKYHIVAHEDSTVTVEGGNYTRESALLLCSQLAAWLRDTEPKKVKVRTSWDIYKDSREINPDGFVGISFRTLEGRGAKALRLAEEHVGDLVMNLQESMIFQGAASWAAQDGALEIVIRELRGEPHVHVYSPVYFGKGKGTQQVFHVPVNEWTQFKRNFIQSLINQYY